tara:strand:+ start:417 stop:668 length:252 start_codon:yes stop_codon:yes gene_type:complete
MTNKKESKWKNILDNLLIYNLYILILGAIFLIISFIMSINGISQPYKLFQMLWYPIYIPSLSLFFSAILIEAVINQVNNKKNT